MWLFLTALLPFVTILTRGFIGYGAVAALTVLIFISGFVKPRVVVFAMALLVGYVGLSVFVTYMRDRSEIRSTVWGGPGPTGASESTSEDRRGIRVVRCFE